MALDNASCAAAITSDYADVRAQVLPSSYSAKFASAYHDYAENGIIIGAVSGGGDKSIIEGFMNSVTSNPVTVINFGAALAEYWSGVGLVPAPPNIASVNNAAGMAGAFAAAILATITTTDTQPYFKTLIDNTEAVAKTIVWTITPPPPASPFVSTVI